MSGYWLDIALVGVLVLINAVFAGSEMALVSLREGQLKSLEREGGAGARRLVRLARDPNRFLATIQIGITLAGFLASATAAVSLAEPLVSTLGVLGNAAQPVAVASVTLALTFLTLVFGELAPKRLAMQRALPWARAVARPLDTLATVSRPAVALLGASTNLVVRAVGGRTEAEPEDISAEELRELVRTHRVLKPEQREIIAGALELRRRTLREVLVPRGNVLWVDAASSQADARNALAAAGHSRAPVRSPRDGQVLGFVHWAAVASGGEGPVTQVMAEPVLLPDTLPVGVALTRLKEGHAHLAVVLDEHGQVDGIVTLEDILEEIVGEIYDETDKDILGVVPAGDGSLTIPGAFPLHDLTDLGIELDPSAHSSEYTTVAGLMLSRLGYIPTAPGDSVPLTREWTATVLAVHHHAITKVTLTPIRPTAPPRADRADRADGAEVAD